MLHMTETRHHRAWDEWVAYCRCGWTGSYLPTQEAARREGDAHLARANDAEGEYDKRKATFEQAQKDRLQALRERAADRPAHLEYIENLDRDKGEAEVPKGVSSRYAEAIYDDMCWIQQDFPEEGYSAHYENAYDKQRRKDAVAARRRAQTKDSLESLLKIEGQE